MTTTLTLNGSDLLRNIDWNEAIAHTNNNPEFLIDVLTELFDESREAEYKITHAIANRDYYTVHRVAHKIKGSALYLTCDKLYFYSVRLVETAILAERSCEDDRVLDDVNAYFDKYRESIQDLVDEFIAWIEDRKRDRD